MNLSIGDGEGEGEGEGGGEGDNGGEGEGEGDLLWKTMTLARHSTYPSYPSLASHLPWSQHF